MAEGTRLELEVAQGPDGLREYDISPSEPAVVIVKGRFGLVKIEMDDDSVRIVTVQGHAAIKRKGSRAVVLYAEPHTAGWKHRLLGEGIKEAA